MNFLDFLNKKKNTNSENIEDVGKVQGKNHSDLGEISS